MAEKKRVYVVGAGASNEVGLPIGSKLKTEIAAKLSFGLRVPYNRNTSDGNIYEAIRIDARNNSASSIEPHIDACKKIHNSMPLATSIDTYIDQHKDNQEIQLCGKLAITESILEAERNCKLAIDNRGKSRTLDLNTCSDTWYCQLWQNLTDGCHKNDLEERFSSIAFVIFNYDRCIEHFLFNSLQVYYGLDEQEAANIMEKLELHHPYGSVGAPSWLNNHHSIEFGAKVDSAQLLDLSSSIRTFTEGSDPETSDITSIQRVITKTEALIFLGFSFHPLNMQLLYPENYKPSESQVLDCYATAFGESPSNSAKIEQLLTNTLSGQMPGHRLKDYVHISNKLKCCDLFKEYSRDLSLAHQVRQQ